MFIQQLYTNCLSEAAYFVESNGECVIIDPLRDIDTYIQLAKEHNAEIKYIFETHFHADFVSGHLELHHATGAPIIYGPNAKTGFECIHALDGEEFQVGNIKIKAMHTPGHTMESTCYLLLDETGDPHCIFTGDTLFIGDVGRPDLFGATMSKEDLAGMLYDSIHSKIKTLPDHVIIYPAHGPGSACGKKMSKETFATLGSQKESNYALLAENKEQFILEVTSGLSEPPAYFPLNAKLNQNGYSPFQQAMINGKKAFSVEEFKSQISEDILLLDTRKATVFTQGFIKGFINIGLEGRFAEWVGTLLPMDKKILLVTEPDQVEESITRLARVGYDLVIGHLEGGYNSWVNAEEPIDMIIDVEADELALDIKHDEKALIIDVRKESEYECGHISTAELFPLQQINDTVRMAFIDDKENNIYVHCAGGYRSVIASSIFKANGFHNIRNVLGGWNAIQKVQEMPIEIPTPQG
jgi:glyoxylase-like metal-dependent hydrolase (beta-lactamase superfamily II)/rhodanese-related sulfurtransferase